MSSSGQGAESQIERHFSAQASVAGVSPHHAPALDYTAGEAMAYSVNKWDAVEK